MAKTDNEVRELKAEVKSLTCAYHELSVEVATQIHALLGDEPEDGRELEPLAVLFLRLRNELQRVRGW